MDKKLNIISTFINGLYVIEPHIYNDDRGCFYRIYCDLEVRDSTKVPIKIKQINHSITKRKGTVRGMHFQYEPNTEVKIIKCIRGHIFDVVVDIRENSPTFLKPFSIKLTDENRKMLYIPKGFAHGFQSLEDNSELIYFHSELYTPSNEGGLNVKDPLLNIEWPLDITHLSKRDQEHKFLNEKFKGIILNEV